MSLLHGLIRGYRRLAAHLTAPKRCLICLDDLPAVALRDAKRAKRPHTSSSNRYEEEQTTYAKLQCKHKFCTDQLVCPVISCKKWVAERDIKHIAGDSILEQFQVILKRKRDERNPSARWCPRPGCEELILCESTANFTCPKCTTVGCFNCRGYAHRFWFCKAREEDESYLKWEKSVGHRHAVRPCPQCRMRIWKAEGHYACYEMPIFMGPLSFLQQLQHVLACVVMLLVVVAISIFGLNAFLTGYMLIWGTVVLMQRMGLVAPPP
uniref:IBR domain-containing protein n=1 Tax=Globisporangium ultimum (strain ATCC 200006 / CBS 805.95 / DAOM BR144) TaxID=431595 RepID=K3WY90_GLOUD